MHYRFSKVKQWLLYLYLFFCWLSWMNIMVGRLMVCVGVVTVRVSAVV